MKSVKKAYNSKEDLYFSMKIPDWFGKLSNEEKISVIERVATKSINPHVLSKQELKSLLVSSRG
jgi:hypothetical protein